MYKYFIVYNYGLGVGNTVLKLDQKLDDLKAIRALEAHITTRNSNIGEVNIINFILLENEPK